MAVMANLRLRSLADPSIISARTILYLLFAFLVLHFGMPRLVFAFRSRFKRPAGQFLPPEYPVRDPIFGTDLFVRLLRSASQNRQMEELSLRFNEILPGGRPVHTYAAPLLNGKLIWSREPEVVKAVFATNFKDWVLPQHRIRILSKGFGPGIFSSDGHTWEESRAMLRPNFKHSEFGDLSFLEEHLQALIKRIPADGSTVDLQELFPLLTIDSATDLLFGKSTGLLAGGDGDKARKFEQSFDYIGLSLSRQIRNPLTKFMRADPKLEDAEKYVKEFVDAIVDEALKMKGEGKPERLSTSEKGERYVFLHELANSDFSRTRIRAELLSIMFAGRDTTAGLLSWMWYELARRPAIVTKLQEELAFLEGAPPTLEQVKSLKYMRFVLNETLRLHPIAPLNSRTAGVDTTLPCGGGPDGKSPIFVLKGQRIVVSFYDMHRRTDLFGDDALDFKPERWETLRPGWSYLPFSGGPRICIGQQLALNEAAYTSARLLQHFGTVEPRDENPMVEVVALTLASKYGCKVGLLPK